MTQELQTIMAALTFDKRLWSYTDVAQYLNRSVKTVTDKISKKPDFPEAIYIDSHPLFEPHDIKAWAKKHKEVSI